MAAGLTDARQNDNIEFFLFSLLKEKMNFSYDTTGRSFSKLCLLGGLLVLLALLSVGVIAALAYPVQDASTSGRSLLSPPTAKIAQRAVPARGAQQNSKGASASQATTPPLAAENLLLSASTSSQCSEQHIVSGGETLSSIAALYSMNWTALASSNTLPDPNVLNVGQKLCIPSATTDSTGSKSLPATTPIVGQANLFQYPQCTWWANERYYQLHHVYVPWTTNADAWQWPARANEFGWHISSTPTVGAIIALQGGVQGSLGLGHVGVVEKILSNDHVITSDMNWGPDPTSVTTVEFSPGPMVSFIRN